MENNEKVADYFTRIVSITNSMKGCGETISKGKIIEKVLRTLPPKFDHIVVAIEESKDLETLKVEELQGSLKAHEQRLIERSVERPADQALVAHVSRKGGGEKEKGKKGFMVKEKGKKMEKFKKQCCWWKFSWSRLVQY